MKLEVINSPFSEEQVKQLNEVLANLTSQQKIWLTGYLSATASLQGIEAQKEISFNTAPVASSPTAVKQITILYASQTGTAQGLAKNMVNNYEI